MLDICISDILIMIIIHFQVLPDGVPAICFCGGRPFLRHPSEAPPVPLNGAKVWPGNPVTHLHLSAGDDHQ